MPQRLPNWLNYTGDVLSYWGWQTNLIKRVVQYDKKGCSDGDLPPGAREAATKPYPPFAWERLRQKYERNDRDFVDQLFGNLTGVIGTTGGGFGWALGVS